jgi:lysophospholipase L1-like esterase
MSWFVRDPGKYPKTKPASLADTATALIDPSSDVGRAAARLSRAGLIPSNPASRRMWNPRLVLATPPTVSAPASSSDPINANATTAGSAITNSKVVPWTNQAIRYLGAHMAVAGGGYPDTTMGKPDSVTHPTPGSHVRIAFGFDGSDFEIISKALAANPANQYRLFVDEMDGTGLRPATAEPQTFTGAAGTQYLHKVAFGSRKPRTIVWESRLMEFAGLRVGPFDRVSYPKLPVNVRAMGFGDSYAEGSNANGPWRGLAAQVLDDLFGPDTWISGVGGTGYEYDATGGKVDYKTRLQHDLIAFAPDVVLICGGYNDVAAAVAASATGAAASTVYSAIRAAKPETIIIVVGPWLTTGTQIPLHMQTRDAIIDACRASDVDLYIDLTGGPIPYSGTAANYTNTGAITGNGSVATPASNGNADYYRTSSADIHPPQAGHDYYRDIIEMGINAWIEAGAPKGRLWTDAAGLSVL